MRTMLPFATLDNNIINQKKCQVFFMGFFHNFSVNSIAFPWLHFSDKNAFSTRFFLFFDIQTGFPLSILLKYV